MTSYSTSFDTFPISRTFFLIFDFKVSRVWLWPMTFRGHLRSKIFSPFESPYMISYSIWLLLGLSLYLVQFSKYSTSRFSGFDFDLWPLEVTWLLRSKIFSPFESPYMTSYSTSIDTFSLSRKVFSYLTSKFLGFDLELWPLEVTWELRSEICTLYESPYMTSYLTSIDTFSLSRTVFNIIDLKNCRVWPWLLTFRGHLGSKIFPQFESPYTTFYLTSIDNSYLVPFSR